VEFAERDSLIIDDISACNDSYHEETIDDEGIPHYWDQFGYELKEPCGCNTCDLSCSADSILYEPPGMNFFLISLELMNGFESSYVLLIWGGAVLVAIFLTIYRSISSKSEVVLESSNQKLLP